MRLGRLGRPGYVTRSSGPSGLRAGRVRGQRGPRWVERHVALHPAARLSGELGTAVAAMPNVGAPASAAVVADTTVAGIASATGRCGDATQVCAPLGADGRADRPFSQGPRVLGAAAPPLGAAAAGGLGLRRASAARSYDRERACGPALRAGLAEDVVPLCPIGKAKASALLYNNGAPWLRLIFFRPLPSGQHGQPWAGSPGGRRHCRVSRTPATTGATPTRTAPRSGQKITNTNSLNSLMTMPRHNTSFSSALGVFLLHCVVRGGGHTLHPMMAMIMLYPMSTCSPRLSSTRRPFRTAYGGRSHYVGAVDTLNSGESRHASEVVSLRRPQEPICDPGAQEPICDPGG